MTRRYAHGQKPQWQITIARGTKVIFHAECADRRECVSLATEARSSDLGLQIWLTSPFGDKSSWD